VFRRAAIVGPDGSKSPGNGAPRDLNHYKVKSPHVAVLARSGHSGRILAVLFAQKSVNAKTAQICHFKMLKNGFLIKFAVLP
jgi:hypothetical protein